MWQRYDLTSLISVFTGVVDAKLKTKNSILTTAAWRRESMNVYMTGAHERNCLVELIKGKGSRFLVPALLLPPQNMFLKGSNTS